MDENGLKSITLTEVKIMNSVYLLIFYFYFIFSLYTMYFKIMLLWLLNQLLIFFFFSLYKIQDYLCMVRNIYVPIMGTVELDFVTKTL